MLIHECKIVSNDNDKFEYNFWSGYTICNASTVCKHTSCGNGYWVLAMRTCVLAFLLKVLLLEFYICEFRKFDVSEN